MRRLIPWVLLAAAPLAAEEKKPWWIAFVRDGQGYLVRVDGKKTKKQERPPDPRDALVSPDGKRSVFLAERIINEGGRRRAIQQIGIVDHDGKNSRMITDLKWGAIDPKFSPKENKVAYRALKKPVRTKGRRSDLVILDLDTGQIDVQVKDDYVHGYAWSSDGKKIAVSTHDRLAFYKVGEAQPFKTLVCSSIDKRLYAHAATNMIWRPDDKAIACNIGFLGGRTEGTVVYGDHQLFVIPLEGKPRALELPFDVNRRPQRWARD